MVETPTVGDWQNLLNQSQNLATQGHQGYPLVQQNLDGLVQTAQAARSRTSRVRSHASGTATTRLLAQQGFDATRLTSDVGALDLRPTVQDVFPLLPPDAQSVEEYLENLQQMTILTTLQEAQQDSISAFEDYMDQCMSRDWSLDKRRLLNVIAPHTPGVGAEVAPAAAGGVSTQLFGAGAGAPPSASAALVGAASLQLQLPPKESAYVEVVRTLGADGGSSCLPDLVQRLKAACETHEDRSHETTMSSCWGLLQDVLRGGADASIPPLPPSPGVAVAVLTESLLQGARQNLERGYVTHLKATIARHRAIAQRGGDPDELKEVQAFLAVQFRTKGALDFQQGGGRDTTWAQAFYCLRGGSHDMAVRAAERCTFPTTTTLPPFSALLKAYITDRAGFRAKRDQHLKLLDACDQLMHGYNAHAKELSYSFKMLLYALLAGDNRTVEFLTRASAPGVADTLEDYMWVKLQLLQPPPPASAAAGSSSPGGMMSMTGAPGYSLKDLQAELGRWKPSYYSKGGKEPLLYLTVLLLSLQFRAGLRFLTRDESARRYRPDAVHWALALQAAGLMRPELGLEEGSGNQGEVDPALLIQSYGQQFVHQDSSLALQYYMLAANVLGGGMVEKGRLLRELLVESHDYGTLLGGGGTAVGGALERFVPDQRERQQLFEAVACECQFAGQPEEAVELFMAAGCPRPALSILSDQLSSLMLAAVEEEATAAGGAAYTPTSDSFKRLCSRAQDAANVMEAGAAGVLEGGPSPRPDLEAFNQLKVIKALLLHTRLSNWEKAAQDVQSLTFIPVEAGRVQACVQQLPRLNHAVQERVQDVLMATILLIEALGQGAAPDRRGRLQAQVEALTAFTTSPGMRNLSKEFYQKLSEVAGKLK